jgi:hypothetical protein
VIPVTLALPSGRAYYLVRPKRGGDRPQVEAFGRWLKDEFAALAKLMKVARRSNARPLIARSLVVAVYAALHGSAFGTKRTSNGRPAMSAFGSKADIGLASLNVRF